MARDIAFVADKDTRDEVGLDGEPLPLHDRPRSEGDAPAVAMRSDAADLPEPATTDPIDTPDAPAPAHPVADAEVDVSPPAPPAAPAASLTDTPPYAAPAAPPQQPDPAPVDVAAPDLASPDSDPSGLTPSTVAPSAVPPPDAVPSNTAPLQPAAEPPPSEEPPPSQKPLSAAAMPLEQADPPAIASPEPASPPSAHDAVQPAPATDLAPPEETAWHTAIADALVPEDGAPVEAAANQPPHEQPLAGQTEAPEPDARSAPREEAAPLPPLQAGAPLAAAIAGPLRIEPRFDAPKPAPAPEPTPAAEPAAPPAAELAETKPLDTAFTSAAEDLFRPPATTDEPHLVTLGRRLDPSLRIPRPVAPVIAPRPEPSDLLADTPPSASAEPAAHTAKPRTWTSAAWKDGTWKDRLRIAARYGAYAVGGYFALVLALIVLFRFVNPPGSMLMLTQALTGTSIDRTWVPLSSISPALVRAVVVSEDSRFCEHGGIDTAAMREAIERAAGGTPRGASTISMQVTKNLFLWNAKSYVRKVIEIPLTLIMELVWPKQRVLEMYLNIAEWGPGIFGAEAAARHHFQKRAANLGEREAALLAAVLPNPLLRVAGNPGPQTSRKARVIQARVKAYGAVASCVVAAPSASTAAPAATPAAKARQPLRKPPARQKPPPKKSNDWAPTLQFGPQ